MIWVALQTFILYPMQYNTSIYIYTYMYITSPFMVAEKKSFNLRDHNLCLLHYEYIRTVPGRIRPLDDIRLGS